MSTPEQPVGLDSGDNILDTESILNEGVVASHLGSLVDTKVCIGECDGSTLEPESADHTTLGYHSGSLAVAAVQRSSSAETGQTPEANTPSADYTEKSISHKGNLQFDLVSDIVIRYHDHAITRQLVAEGLRSSPIVLSTPSQTLTNELLKRLEIGLTMVKGIPRSSINKGLESITNEHLRSQAEAALCEITAALTLLAAYFAPWAERRADTFARERKLPQKETRDEALGTLYASIAKYIRSSGITFQCFAGRQMNHNFAIFAKRKVVWPRRLFTALTEFPAGEASVQLRQPTASQVPQSEKCAPYPKSKTREDKHSVSNSELVVENKTTVDASPTPLTDSKKNTEEILPLSKRINQALGENRTRNKPRRGRRTGHHGRRTPNM